MSVKRKSLSSFVLRRRENFISVTPFSSFAVGEMRFWSESADGLDFPVAHLKKHDAKNLNIVGDFSECKD